MSAPSVLMLFYGEERVITDMDTPIVHAAIPNFRSARCYQLGSTQLSPEYRIHSYSETDTDLALIAVLRARRASYVGDLVLTPLSSFDDLTHLILYFDDDVCMSWLKSDKMVKNLIPFFAGQVDNRGEDFVAELPPQTTSMRLLNRGWLLSRDAEQVNF